MLKSINIFINQNLLLVRTFVFLLFLISTSSHSCNERQFFDYVHAQIEDAKTRSFVAALLRDYRTWARENPKDAENFKHLSRLVTWKRELTTQLAKEGVDLDSLEAGIWLSDRAKHPELVKKYVEEFDSSAFATFLDHAHYSILEGEALRLQYPLDQKTWDKIVLAILGHDGPPSFGSWWGENYKKVTGKNYTPILTKEGFVHAYFDRIDQGSLMIQKGKAEGGVRKIGSDLLEQNPKLTLQEWIGLLQDNNKRTWSQVDQLENEIAKNFFDRPENILQVLSGVRKNLEKTRDFFSFVEKNLKTLPDGTVQIENRVIKTPEDFWSYAESVKILKN